MDDTLGERIATLGSIDTDEIDWQNVSRATFLIHQQFRYTYPGPISFLRQRLMVVPPDFHEEQRLVTHKLRVTGRDVEIERSHDTFGNVIVDVSLERVEREVEFTAWIVVEREAALNGYEPEALAPDARLGQPSRLTAPDPALRAVAAELREIGAEGADLAALIGTRVHEHFRYEHGVTDVRTPADEAWAGGVGVCQDYAHCMLALCRLCDLPARYVSGHLLGEGGTHAWVEVLVAHPSEPEALCAVAFDPTHDRRAGLRYVTVAVGRDYSDVPPTSGTFEGSPESELSTHKRAAVTRIEHVRPPRRRRPGPARHA